MDLSSLQRSWDCLAISNTLLNLSIQCGILFGQQCLLRAFPHNDPKPWRPSEAPYRQFQRTRPTLYYYGQCSVDASNLLNQVLLSTGGTEDVGRLYPGSKIFVGGGGSTNSGRSRSAAVLPSPFLPVLAAIIARLPSRPRPIDSPLALYRIGYFLLTSEILYLLRSLSS